MIKPGKLVIAGATVTVYGDMANTRFRSTRIIRSAHRGGDWFDEREAVTKHAREKWLCKIRAIEVSTDTVVHQQHILMNDIQ